jgi:hypothetical protein
MRIDNSPAKVKKFIVYCPKCDYEKLNAYFMPFLCPRCRSKLHSLSLTLEDYKTFDDIIKKEGCRAFAKKYIKRGSIIYNRVD